MGRHKTLPDEDVLKIARLAFLKEGHSASTREIAEATGLSQATLFQRFGDKSDIFVAAMLPDPINIRFVVDGDQMPLQGSREALEAIAGRLLKTMQDRIPLLRRLAGYPDLDPKRVAKIHASIKVPDLAKAMEDRFSIWKKNDKLPNGIVPADLVEALFLATHGVIMMAETSKAHNDLQAATAIRRFVQTVWR